MTRRLSPPSTVPSEHAEQVALLQWAKMTRKRLPELALLFAIPNGGDRNAIVAKKLKAEGVRAGVPDLFLPVARDRFHGLFLEMKRTDKRPVRNGKGGVSPQQSQWIDALRDQNYRVEVCYGWQESAAVLESYLTEKSKL